MLGWHISVYRQLDGGQSPAQFGSPEGPRIAVWQSGVDGLDWLHREVGAGRAINLGGDGYPVRYTATAGTLLPKILDSPPAAREDWLLEAGDIVTEKWEGRTALDRDAAAQCLPDEWLLVEAWDES